MLAVVGVGYISPPTDNNSHDWRDCDGNDSLLLKKTKLRYELWKLLLL